MLEKLTGVFKRESFDKKIDSIVDGKVTSILNSIEIVPDTSRENQFIIKTGGLDKLKGKKSFTKINVKDFMVKQESKRVNRQNMITITSQYDYSRIDSFFQKEAYFARAMSRQFETMVRNGYGFVSDKPEHLALIRKYIRKMETANNIRLDQSFAKIHIELSTHGICIIQKLYKTETGRNGEASKKLNGFRILHPSALVYYFNSKTGEFLGVDIMSSVSENRSTSISTSSKISRLNRLLMSNYNSNKQPDVPVSELIVLKVYQDDMNFFPEPPSMQILDDILTLRSIEETIELLIFQYGSPFLHGTVGTEEEPARPGEVDLVRNEVAAMASNGFIVTDHRVTFNPINLLTNVADFASLLSYFKTRVLIGSGSSGVSVGEGDTANRSTADSIDDGLADHCMFYSGILSFMMNYHFVPEILWQELGIDDSTDDDGDPLVELVFNEVKLDKQISIENSIINLFQANLLPHNRAMKRLKQIPMKPEEEKELYLNKIQIPLAEAGKTITPGSSSSTSPGASSQPSNQHVKKSGPGSTKNTETAAT